MPNGQTRPPGPILGACNRMIAVVFVTIAEATLDVSCSPHCCLILSPLLPSWMFLACPFIVFFSSCHHCSHLGCGVLVPLLSFVLSALLPPWMFLARPIVAPLSSCHPCSHLGCFLLVALLSLPHLVTIAQRSCRRGWQHCYCHLGVFLLLVVLPPSSCHHGCYHLGVVLLVPSLTLMWSSLLPPGIAPIAVATLGCSCYSCHC